MLIVVKRKSYSHIGYEKYNLLLENAYEYGFYLKHQVLLFNGNKSPDLSKLNNDLYKYQSFTGFN